MSVLTNERRQVKQFIGDMELGIKNVRQAIDHMCIAAETAAENGVDDGVFSFDLKCLKETCDQLTKRLVHFQWSRSDQSDSDRKKALDSLNLF